VFQQLLLAMDVRDSTSATPARITFARSLLTQAQTGVGFTAMVRQHSEDTVTNRGDGFLVAATNEDLPPSIARAIWGLGSGELSAITPSPRGIHIFRRATAQESRAGLKVWLAPRLAMRADSVFADSISQAAEVRVVDGANDRMRALAADPMQDEGGDGPLVTWKNGSLSPAVARLWLSVVPPRARVGIPSAADSAVTSMLYEMGRQEILIAHAAPGGIPTPDARAALNPQYRSTLEALLALWTTIGGSGSPTAAARAVMDTVATGKIAYRPPPGALGALLRTRAKVTVDSDAVAAIVAEAVIERSRRQAGDSAGSGGGDSARATP